MCFDLTNCKAVAMAAATLLTAAKRRDKELLSQVLERGTDVNMLLDEDCGQWTPLHLLAADGDKEGCELLVEAGASLLVTGVRQFRRQQKTSDAYQPLHLAARNGHVETVEFLVDQGAPVDGLDAHGYTPLHYAAAFGHAVVATVLLRKGCDATTKDELGCTAAQLAKAAGHQDVYEVISDSESLEAGIGRVARWLRGIQLLEYAPKFVEAGLDDLNFIAQVGLTEADVDQLGIDKKLLGPRKKLMSLYRIQEFLKSDDGSAAAGSPGAATDAAAPPSARGASDGAGSDDDGSGDEGSDGGSDEGSDEASDEGSDEGSGSDDEASSDDESGGEDSGDDDSDASSGDESDEE